MTYRVYLRWPDQTVSDKTVTEDRALADMAYQTLLKRVDLVGTRVTASFTYSPRGGKAQPVAYHRFDREPATPPTSAGPAVRPTITIKKAHEPS